MPSHVYRNLGHYDLASEANERAVAADRRFLKEVAKHHPVARYPLHYLGHNLHFLVTTQVAQGRFGPAQKTARELTDLVVEFVGGDDVKLNKDMVRDEAARFLAVPLTVSWQFDLAQWKETSDRVRKARAKVEAVLKQAGAENADLPYTRAMLAYGNTLHALKGKDWKAAVQHAKELMELTKRPESELQNNPVGSVYRIAGNVLVARAAQAVQDGGDGRPALAALLDILEAPFDKATPTADLALKAWQAAVERQDQLNYNDPPKWYYPVRQSLGAAYFLGGRFADAENTFRQDLKINPGNPRSLFGLIESLRRQDRSVPTDLERQFKKLWGGNPPPSFETM